MCCLRIRRGGIFFQCANDKTVIVADEDMVIYGTHERCSLVSYQQIVYLQQKRYEKNDLMKYTNLSQRVAFVPFIYNTFDVFPSASILHIPFAQ